MGVLAEEQRDDVDALQGAILDVVYRVMEQHGCLVPLAPLEHGAESNSQGPQRLARPVPPLSASCAVKEGGVAVEAREAI
jgi:hypothetical protein